MLSELFTNVVLLAVIALLANAGFSKLNNANAAYYQSVFSNYGMFSSRLFDLVAIKPPQLVGLVELALAILCLVPATQSIGLALSLCLLLSYTALLGYQLAQGKRLEDCGCAGTAGGIKVDGWLLTRNIVLCSVIGLAVWMSQAQATVFQLQPLLTVLSAGCLILVALIYVSFGQLIANRQKIIAIQGH